MALDLPADGDVLAVQRCPDCRAAVPRAAPWCTQCWRDLRAPAPEPAPPVAPPPADDGPEPGSGWPCTCGKHNALTEDACGTCGAGLFDALRGEGGPLLAVPVLGDVARMSKAQLGMAAGALLPVLLTALLAVLALAGALLT